MTTPLLSFDGRTLRLLGSDAPPPKLPTADGRARDSNPSVPAAAPMTNGFERTSGSML
jgi:hypothetical protein